MPDLAIELRWEFLMRGWFSYAQNQPQGGVLRGKIGGMTNRLK